MTIEKMALAKAINESLRTALEADPKVLVMGEDVGKLGGVFRVTDGLQKDFGEERAQFAAYQASFADSEGGN